jgi:hypothetical protein
MRSIGFYLTGVGTIWLSFAHRPELDAAPQSISLHNTATGEVALCSHHYNEFRQIPKGDIAALRNFYQRRVVQVDPADFVRKLGG